MSVIFYARVSTADQNLDHQIAQAQAAGFAIDEIFADHGVSGISTSLAERPREDGSSTSFGQAIP